MYGSLDRPSLNQSPFSLQEQAERRQMIANASNLNRHAIEALRWMATVQQAQQQIQAVDAQRQAAEDRVIALQNELQLSSEQLKVDTEQLRQRIDELEQEKPTTAKLVRRCEKYKQQTTQLKTEVKVALARGARVEELDEALHGAQEEIEQLRNEIDKLREATASFSDLLEERERLRSYVNVLNNKIVQLEEEHKVTKFTERLLAAAKAFISPWLLMGDVDDQEVLEV